MSLEAGGPAKLYKSAPQMALQLRTLNHSGQLDAVFLDMSKVFDTVPIHRLCYKLTHYGIHDCTLNWIKQLLTGRTQQVVINGKYSNSTKVISGVPQGPLLFLCYVNDIAHNISSSVCQYADDTLVYRPVNDETDVTALQYDLDTVMKWAQDWHMSFNQRKTEFLRTTNKHNYIPSSYY